MNQIPFHLDSAKKKLRFFFFDILFQHYHFGHVSKHVGFVGRNVCNGGWRWTFIIYSPQIQPLAFFFFFAAFMDWIKHFQRGNVCEYGVNRAFQEI